jgi:hypothetical protein
MREAHFTKTFVSFVPPLKKAAAWGHYSLRKISHFVRDDRRVFLIVIPSGCEESFPRDFSLSAGVRKLMNHFVEMTNYLLVIRSRARNLSLFETL